MWEFSLSDIEKDKIEFHYEKTGTFLILLVCINKTAIKLENQVALLQWEDYCEIRHRSNIQLGIWRNQETKTQRSKVYYLRKGKGQKKDFFITVKRNLIEKKLDEFYINEPTDLRKTKEKATVDEVESNYVELKPESVGKSIKQSTSKKVYIKDNIKWCGLCRCKTKESENKIKSISKVMGEREKTVYGYTCPKCNKTYITTATYEQVLKDKTGFDGVAIERIKTLVDKVYLTPDYGCIQCDETLVVSSCRLKIYENIEENNKVEKSVDEELFYCKNCGLYFVTRQLHKELLDKYGKNKINFVITENIQRTFSLL